LEVLASGSSPQSAQLIREIARRLEVVEGEHRRLCAERNMLRDTADAKLAELNGRTAALADERKMLQQALAAAEHARRDAERTAEALREHVARTTTALAAAKEELISTRAREAAIAARLKARKVLPDVGGYQRLRPDPLSAQTATELIDVLRQFRTWAGNPSYRDMALRSGRRAGASTMCTVLGGSELPARLEVIDAIIEGCGGTDEDRQKFATAWRKLAMPCTEITGQSFAAEPRLRVIPGAGGERLIG
jgi:hypothetical protein